jgi:hypothetical protein
LGRPKLSKEKVKRLMKKNKKYIVPVFEENYSKTENDFVSRWKSEEANLNWTSDRDQLYEE